MTDQTSRRTRRSILLALVLCAFFILYGCSSPAANETNEQKKGTYTQISQEEASKMMELDDGHIIVDVRRQDEYD